MATRGGAVHVVTTRRHYKDKTYETHLLRRSYREAGKVRSETVGNLSHLPEETIELIRRSLKGESFVPAGPLGEDGFEILRSLPHGHVAAVAAMAKKLDLVSVIGPPCRERDLVVSLVLARCVSPGSKLAATRFFADSTVGADLEVSDAAPEEVYKALDWLLSRKDAIERSLAARHLSVGGRVLFDLTSAWMEGSACPLTARGHSRDGKRNKSQIEYGILADKDGRPVAVEIVPGNTGDPTAFVQAVESVRSRFRLEQVTFVGDRGMITTARIAALRKLPGASWITALRAPQIKALVEAGAIQLSLFDTANLAEITHPDYPGERLMVCLNPVLAEKRAHTREALLQATEANLEKLKATVKAGRLKDPVKIAFRAGRIVSRHKMAKHFELEITEGSITWTTRQERIAAEAATDGIYVVRTPIPKAELSAAKAVAIYKSLAEVESDFRSWKAIDLRLRPIFLFTEDHVRAHIVLCLLAGYLTWHLRRVLAPITFSDTKRPGVEREDPVSPALRSSAAKRKDAIKQTETNEPVYSYQDLLKHLATLTRNTCKLAGTSACFDKLAVPTPTQRRVFELIGTAMPLRLM